MEFDVIIIVAAVLSLIWFITVLVLLDKIAKYLRLSLQAKYYNGLYIGMKIKHIAQLTAQVDRLIDHLTTSQANISKLVESVEASGKRVDRLLNIIEKKL